MGNAPRPWPRGGGPTIIPAWQAKGKRVRCGGAIERVRPTPPLSGFVPEAVVLDMDGTLLDTESAYRQAFLAAAATLGQPVAEEVYGGLIGISSRERGALLRAWLGPGFPWEACLREYRRRKAALLAGPLRTKPGAEALLAEIAAQGLACAVATSASRRTALAALGRVGLLPAIPALVTRDEVAAGKPDPALFLRAAETLGTEPRHCLAVEDSPPGVAAARAAGMRVVMVPDALPPPAGEKGDGLMVAVDLLEVRDLLRNLRNGEGSTA